MKEIRRKKWEESNLKEVRRKPRHCRTSALLRANKQIYSEAYPLLYSELKIVLIPGAVLSRVMHPDPLAKPTGGIWRYDPAIGIDFKYINGHICYESECMDGDMEPHFFAKFKKIVFNADFPVDEYGEPPALYIDKSLRGKSENEAHFKDCIKSLAVIQRLVHLLSDSPLINHLEISLNFEVYVDYDYFNSSDDDGSDFDDEGFTIGERKIQNMTEAANERATELFLESGLLDPLHKLSNVQSFVITFDRMAYRSSDTPWQPSPTHASTIEELKKNDGNELAEQVGPSSLIGAV